MATGTILALATALGVLFASLASANASTTTSVLFGNLLAISQDQLWVYAAFTLAVVVTLAVLARPLLFASVDPAVAEARGVPVRALGLAFVVLLALTITMAVQVVGTLLLFALVVTPAATALRITARPGRVALIAVALALARSGAGWCSRRWSTCRRASSSCHSPCSPGSSSWPRPSGAGTARPNRSGTPTTRTDLRGRDRRLTRMRPGSPFRGVSRTASGGHALYMADMQREIRVSDDSTEAQTEESRTPEQATATVARMLANPRRVRRN